MVKMSVSSSDVEGPLATCFQNGRVDDRVFWSHVLSSGDNVDLATVVLAVSYSIKVVNKVSSVAT